MEVWKIQVWIIFHLLHHVSGQSPTLKGPGSVTLGSSSQFVCTLSWAYGSSVAQNLTAQNLTFENGQHRCTACLTVDPSCTDYSSSSYSCRCQQGTVDTCFFNITSVAKLDGGNWACTFGGNTSNSIHLAVHYAPTISSSFPQNANVLENNGPHINCGKYIIHGNPPDTSYTWTGPDRYNYDGSVLDKIFTRTQGGLYTCTAHNSAGLNDTSQVNINVQYAPTISSSFPQNANVLENNGPYINCSKYIIQGNPPDTSYTWTGPDSYNHHGSVLDKIFTRTQGGLYTCTAYNNAGLNDTAQVNINVQYAPTISSSFPQNANVLENNGHHIDCSKYIIQGNPPDTSYTWTGPDSYNHHGSVLDKIFTRTQGGLYTCTAHNSAGLNDTAQVNINVQYAPTISSPFPQNANVLENNGHHIDCSNYIIHGNPPDTSYMWTGPGRYNYDGSVLDKIFTRTQGGLYTCTAYNSAGLNDTAQVNINVQYVDVPVLTISPSVVGENDSVGLTCEVSSNPTPILTIKNVDNDTILVDHELNNHSHLVIQKAQCLHNGTVQCETGIKGVQDQVKTAPLTVTCIPRRDYRKDFKETFVAGLNQTARLTVHVIANPLPDFTWWRHDYDQRKATRVDSSLIYSIDSTHLQSVLYVNVMNPAEYGRYSVTAQNDHGSCEIWFTLTSNSPPFPPTQYTATPTGKGSVILHWKSNYNGGAPQDFFLEFWSSGSKWKTSLESGIPDPGRGKISSITISGLTAKWNYSFVLYSNNSYGESQRVMASVVVTQQEATSLVGPIAGGISAAVVALCGTIFAVVLYRRGAFINCRREAVRSSREQDDMAVENVVYSSLQRSSGEALTYDELRVYQNTCSLKENMENIDGNTIYATLHKDKETPSRQSAVYANSTNETQDHLYANTGRT